MSSGKTVKLGSIAEIIPGVSVRDYELRDPAADVLREGMAKAYLVPISALDEESPLKQDKTQPAWIKSSIVSREAPRTPAFKHFDIVITNRNEPRVVLISEFEETICSQDDRAPNVATGPLMIIRLKEQGGYFFWRAQYLAWWLGHHKSRRVLRRLMKGTTVKVLSRADLEDLDVPLPAPDERLQGATTEKLIADEADKAKELRRMLHEQAELEYRRIQEVLYRMATGELPVIK